MFVKLFVFGICSVIASHAIAGEDRLLPSEEEAKVEAKARYDNGAYYITIKNNSSHVVTEGRVTCSVIHYDAANRKNELWGEEDFQKRDKSGRLINAYATQFDKSISPGGKLELYVEYAYSKLRDGSCSLRDARGRKPRFYEVF